MDFTNRDTNLIGAVLMAQTALDAFPKFPKVTQAIAVLDRAVTDYDRALAEVNTVERRIEGYASVAQQAAQEHARLCSGLPDPAVFANWSADSRRLKGVIEDARTTATAAFDSLLVPAKDALEHAPRRMYVTRCPQALKSNCMF